MGGTQSTAGVSMTQQGRLNKQTFQQQHEHVKRIFDNIVHHYDYGLDEQYCNKLRIVIQDDVLSQFGMNELKTLNARVFLVDSDKYEYDANGKVAKQAICSNLAKYYVRKINLICILCKTVMMMHRRLSNIGNSYERRGFCFPPSFKTKGNLKDGLKPACWKRDETITSCTKIPYNLPVVSERGVSRGINHDAFITPEQFAKNMNMTYDALMDTIEEGKKVLSRPGRTGWSDAEVKAAKIVEYMDDEFIKKIPVAKMGDSRGRLDTEPIFNDTFITQIREKTINSANIPRELTDDLRSYLSYLEIYDFHDCSKTDGEWTTDEAILSRFFLTESSVSSIDHPYAKEWLKKFRTMEEISYTYLDGIIRMLETMVEPRTANDKGTIVSRYFDKLVPVNVLFSYIKKAQEIIPQLFEKTDTLFFELMDLSDKLYDSIHGASEPYTVKRQEELIEKQREIMKGQEEALLMSQYGVVPKREEEVAVVKGGSSRKRKSHRRKRRSSRKVRQQRRYKK